MLAFDALDQPLPEGKWLRVWIVDTEDIDPLFDPVEDNAPQLLPQLAPGVAFEIERIDVLIFLRWILGVLNRAIGPMAKPLGMLLHVGVVGRALIGQVERDFDALVARRRYEGSQIGQRAELRMN